MGYRLLENRLHYVCLCVCEFVFGAIVISNTKVTIWILFILKLKCCSLSNSLSFLGIIINSSFLECFLSSLVDCLDSSHICSSLVVVLEPKYMSSRGIHQISTAI